MHARVDEGAANPGAGAGGLLPVVDNEVQQFAQIIKPGPFVQLFPLVRAHEPVELVGGVLVVPVFGYAPAPAGRGELQVQLTY